MPASDNRRVHADNVGAWVLRCDQDTWDLRQFRADGHTYLARWSVHRSYRLDLMRAGQNVVLWVTGGDKRPASGKLAPGVWGVGHLTGSPVDDVPDPMDQQGYWINGRRDQLPDAYVSLYVPLLSVPVPRSTVADDPELGEIEILHAQRISNPSYLTKPQWHRLQQVLPLLDENDQPVARNDEVEVAAVRAVRSALEADGWKTVSVEKENRGWDLTARRDGIFRLVEVKGRTPWSLSVMLTRNEARAARDDARWELAVVPDALGTARVYWFDRHTALAAAEPTGYQLVLDARDANR